MYYSLFHINVKERKGSRRTTISIEPYLVDLLAIKLGEVPRTESAHKHIRTWIQGKQNEIDSDRIETNWIKEKIVLEITDKYLSESLWEWRFQEEEKYKIKRKAKTKLKK